MKMNCKRAPNAFSLLINNIYDLKFQIANNNNNNQSATAATHSSRVTPISLLFFHSTAFHYVNPTWSPSPSTSDRHFPCHRKALSFSSNKSKKIHSKHKTAKTRWWTSFRWWSNAKKPRTASKNCSLYIFCNWNTKHVPFMQD